MQIESTNNMTVTGTIDDTNINIVVKNEADVEIGNLTIKKERAESFIIVMENISRSLHGVFESRDVPLAKFKNTENTIEGSIQYL